MVAADRDRGAQPLVGVVGGIRTSTIATSGWCSATAALERLGVADRGDDLMTAVGEDLGQARPDHGGVLGDEMRMGVHLRRATAVLRLRPWGRRPGCRCRAAVDGADPFGQAAQAAAVHGGGAAVAVVGDADPEQAGDVHGFEGSVPRVAVLGHVGEQFGRGEVGDGLDRRRGRSGMSVTSSTGTALRAARVISASGRPLSSTEGWMPRARVRSFRAPGRPWRAPARSDRSGRTARRSASPGRRRARRRRPAASAAK